MPDIYVAQPFPTQSVVAIDLKTMVKALTLRWSAVLPTRQHVLNHLFVTPNNGFWWRCGGLRLHPGEDPKLDTLLTMVRDGTAPKKSSKESQIAEVVNYAKSIGLSDETVKDIEKRANKNLTKPFQFDALSEQGSRLFLIPNDIQKDWLAGAYETIDLILRTRLQTAKARKNRQLAYIAKSRLDKQFPKKK